MRLLIKRKMQLVKLPIHNKRKTQTRKNIRNLTRNNEKPMGVGFVGIFK